MISSKVNMKRWSIGIMTGAAILAAAAPAYADTTASAVSAAGAPRHESVVEKLVEEGTISQSTYEAIQSYMEANRPANHGADGTDGFLSGAVTEGIISQETADQLKAYIESRMQERQSLDDSETGRKGRGGSRTEMWDNMLSAGVITQSEYDSIIAAMPQRDPAGQTE